MLKKLKKKENNMTKISLKEFIDKTKGTKVDVPWGNGKLKGQCVSLVQQYIHQCLGTEFLECEKRSDF